MVPLILFFGSLACSLIFTPYLISIFQTAGVVDIPGGRKIHTNIVPRMGGILLGFSGILVFLVYSVGNTNVLFLFLSFSILFLCGIIDDIFHLNCWIKFLLQNIASLMLILYFSPLFANISLLGINFSNFIGILILHFFIVGTINAVNLLDGLDGLLGGISLIFFSIILAISIISFNPILIALSLSLIGALLGFLRYNSFPASIFLGDTGSLSLGFFLVVASLLVSLNVTPTHLDLTIPLLLLALPIIDCIKVFVMRLYKKRSPFSPDNLHIHYVLTLNGISQKFTVFILELITISFVLFLLLYIKGSHLWSIIFFSLLSLIIIFIEPVLIKLKSAGTYLKYLRPAFEETDKNLPAIRKNFIFLLGVVLFLKLVVSFPVTSAFDRIEILYLLIIGAIYLLVSLFQQKFYRKVFEPNIFLNISFFFLLSKLSFSSDNIFNSEVIALSGFSSVLIFAFAISFLLYISVKDKRILNRNMLFSGIDLTMIIVVFIVFLLSTFYSKEMLSQLSISLVEGFSVYIVCKVIIRVRYQTAGILTLISFLLPLSALATIYIISV